MRVKKFIRKLFGLSALSKKDWEKLFQKMYDDEQSAMQKHMNLPDWIYRDLPRMTPEFMDKFIGIVGKEEIKFITFADYGKTVRGQVMISPVGVDRIKTYRAIEKAVEQTVEKFGIDYVKNLSMFPSSDYWKDNQDA